MIEELLIPKTRKERLVHFVQVRICLVVFCLIIMWVCLGYWCLWLCILFSVQNSDDLSEVGKRMGVNSCRLPDQHRLHFPCNYWTRAHVRAKCFLWLVDSSYCFVFYIRHRISKVLKGYLVDDSTSCDGTAWQTIGPHVCYRIGNFSWKNGLYI